MIFLSMCFLVSYNYIEAEKGHYDFFFLHNYMDFIDLVVWFANPPIYSLRLSD